MTFWLRVMDSYLVHLTSPENTSFSTGDMIDIVLVVIPKKWVDKTIETKVEPRNLTFNELIDHCNNLENQENLNADKPGSKKRKHKSNYGIKIIQIKRLKDTTSAKLSKVNSNAWKTHTAANYNSNKYYESKIKGGDGKNYNSYHRNEKLKFSKTMRATILAQVKNGIRKALKNQVWSWRLLFW